ncbi:MAG: LacI family DNA-binding transcriptional regulator, partial [Bacteroidales bacterium]
MAEKKAQRVTMHTVADRAGVSQTTVSLVINKNAENISEDTRNRVWEAVKELGFRPNAAARRMRTHRSNFIGFITDQIATTPHAGKIVKGAQEVGWEGGKIILLINTDGNSVMEKEAIEVLMEQEVEGIIYASMFNHAVTPPETLRDVPTVLLDCFAQDHSFSAVIPDEIGGGYTATEALLKRGHRRVAFANHNLETGGSVGRLIGYKRALADYGISFDESLVCYDVGEADGGYRCSQKLFTLSDRPTAIFCFNDRMAMGLFDGLRKLNLS